MFIDWCEITTHQNYVWPQDVAFLGVSLPSRDWEEIATSEN